MRTSKDHWPIATLCYQRERIDTQPDYQRPAVWKKIQRQMLIDSILRKYDIPKVYLQRMGDDEYAVIDGQQRIRAIWDFQAGKYALPKDMEPVLGIDCAGQKYADLNTKIAMRFDTYAIDVVIVEDAVRDEKKDEIGDMFLRLQNGTTLKAQEKRNAMSGEMKDFVKATACHPFFEKSCNFSTGRYLFDQVAAQMICLEIAGGPTNIKKVDLDHMYQENVKFDSKGKVAKKVNRVLEYLYKAFPDKTGELKRYNVIMLYCLASKLIDDYACKDTEKMLASWLIDFEAERREDNEKPEDERDPELIEYKRLTSYSTDGKESIQDRLRHVEGLFFADHPDIELKDPKRGFSSEQRLGIYRRDGGHCQIKQYCDGSERLGWDSGWHVDHIKSHSDGGETTVANGRVACAKCNTAKGARSD